MRGFLFSAEQSKNLVHAGAHSDHVLGNARLGDFKSKLEQFAVDAGRAPQRVFIAHLPDQGAQLHADLRPPASRA